DMAFPSTEKRLPGRVAMGVATIRTRTNKQMAYSTPQACRGFSRMQKQVLPTGGRDRAYQVTDPALSRPNEYNRRPTVTSRGSSPLLPSRPGMAHTVPA